MNSIEYCNVFKISVVNTSSVFTTLCEWLYDGDAKLNLIANRIIIEASISFVERSKIVDINSF